MLPQNKITGMSVAWGRAKWKTLENGSMGYVFPEEDAYQIRVTQQYMDDEGFTEDDLYDCIEQVEMKYGSPDQHRHAFGLLPNAGYSNLGLTVRSRSNPNVTCVFTPTSTEDKDYDGYFEWYYSRDSGGVDNLQQYLSVFDRSTGGRHTNVNTSPITMPSYQEASDRTWDVLEKSQRESFLRQLWNYHKTESKGFKLKMESDLMPVWMKVIEKKQADS